MNYNLDQKPEIDAIEPGAKKPNRTVTLVMVGMMMLVVGAGMGYRMGYLKGYATARSGVVWCDENECTAEGGHCRGHLCIVPE
ncbi:MAG TPA: hypothetical protein VFN67_14830 [Polyangiales bacterium]|nr:hypothetical protein [Polyangiales bacterium]